MRTNEMRPLTSEERAALREDIEARGIVMPVVLRAADRSVIDGHHRLAIAAELGITAPDITLDVSEDEARELGLALNIHRRQLTGKQRKEAISRMRDAGIPVAQITARTGASKRTIMRARSSEEDNQQPKSEVPNGTSDLMGRRRSRRAAAPKMSAAEQARLVDAVLAARERGYPDRLIAEAARMKHATLHDMMVRTGNPKGKSGRRIVKPPPEPLEPIEWRDKQQPRTLPALYRRSTTVALLRSFTDNLRHDNAVNRLANDAADASKAGDADWLAETSRTVDDTMTYLTRLRSVLDDEAARHRAITDPRERDDIGSHLRAVKDGS